METLIEILAYCIGFLKWIFTGRKKPFKYEVDKEHITIYSIGILLAIVIPIILIGIFYSLFAK